MAYKYEIKSKGKQKNMFTGKRENHTYRANSRKALKNIKKSVSDYYTFGAITKTEGK